MTDRKTLVEKVALAIQLADECEIPYDYSNGLDPNVSDWGAFLADAAIDLFMQEAVALRAENERLKVESIQMQAALGYGILAEDERHILPSNPFKCGTCDASKHLCAENERLKDANAQLQEIVNSDTAEEERIRAENERLREALREYECHCSTSVCEWFPCGHTARAALEDRHD